MRIEKYHKLLFLTRGLLDEARAIATGGEGDDILIDTDDPRWPPLWAKIEKIPSDLVAAHRAKPPMPIDPGYDPAKHRYVGRCCS